MSTNRETKEVKIGEHTLVLKTYANGREYNEVQAVYLRSAKINMVGSTPTVSGFTGEVELDATKKAIEVLAVSLDGKTDSVIELIEELPYEEYQLVTEAVNELIGKKK